jgi:hypothetical protein
LIDRENEALFISAQSGILVILDRIDEAKSQITQSIGLYAFINEISHLQFRSPIFVFAMGIFKNDPRSFW